MGRAIVREPSAFLMDEPLSNLDAKLRVQMRTEVSRIQSRLGTTTVYVTHDQTEAMTLGDRVAVMRKGLLQQVGKPQDLYDEPVNLFVAGFIGSPSMNFMPVELLDGKAKLPFAEVELSDERREVLESAGSKNLLAGIRPEHFEDASLAPDHPGPSFKVKVEILESMGSELYAYFDVEGSGERSEQLDELAADAGADMGSGDQIQIVARLDAASERPGARSWSCGWTPIASTSSTSTPANGSWPASMGETATATATAVAPRALEPRHRAAIAPPGRPAIARPSMRAGMSARASGRPRTSASGTRRSAPGPRATSPSPSPLSAPPPDPS